MALLAGIERTDGHVFCETGSTEPLTTNQLQYAWSLLREKAGVPAGRLHDFRHTTGTFAAQAGLNAFMVRDLLGHKTMAMTTCGSGMAQFVGPLELPCMGSGSPVSGVESTTMTLTVEVWGEIGA